MSLTHTFIKTATAVAIATGFGAAHAQYEELTQIQQPSSSAGPVRSGMVTERRDETVRQTQQASATSGAIRADIPTDRRDETVRQTQPAGSHNAHRSGDTQSAQTMQPHMNNRADMDMRNMRMGNERMARADRN